MLNKSNLNKKYDFKFIQNCVDQILNNKKIYEFNYNHKGPKFSIILPPPNITGQLHLGHAWDVSLQDAIIRYKHLQGFNTIWISGLDHASIATQTKFEKILKEKENKSRFDFSKKEFLSKLNIWCEEQKQTIRNQWKCLNLALSLDSQCYTMDKHVNEAVVNWFVDAYKNGLIYQNLKLVNWDMKLQTAISDIEVIYKKTQSKMYYLKYYFENKNDYLLVATTRPETIFGDCCLVINPNDLKNKKYIGKNVINPLTSQIIPIIGDEYVNLDFGTKIMKCTPAHDFNDYAIAKKHNIKNYINIFNPNGTLNKFCVDYKKNKYIGIQILKAREMVVNFLKNNNLLTKIENIENNIGYSERTNTIVEPFLSKQWFVKMKPFAKQIIKLQNSNDGVKFFPKRFNNQLLEWMKGIQDWCISRQLWWGHQLPVWHNKNKIYVGKAKPKDLKKWVQDENVLDTWFSSGLWPLVCTCLRNEKQYKAFYPTNCLVTAYDILFFWVGRMMTMCNKNNIVPFKHCLIHGLIRDKFGRKMSKSLGNGVNPIDLINKYGSDALKMYFTSSATLGEDIKFNEEKIKYYWNVLNKIWNSYKLIASSSKINNISLPKKLNLFDCWMLEQLKIAQKHILNLCDKYDFTVANQILIDCFWNNFCNKYLEFIKPNLNNKHDQNRQKMVALFIFNEFLKLFYPIAPSLCDYLFYDINKKLIWNEKVECLKNKQSKKYDSILMKHFINITTYLRDYRIKNSLNKNNLINFDYGCNEKISIDILNSILILFNLKINKIVTKNDISQNTIAIAIPNGIIYLHEQKKQQSKNDILKRLKIVEFEIKRAQTILANKNFLLKAPKEKVKLEKSKLEKYINEKKQIEELLK